jgi:hypothetical protein
MTHVFNKVFIQEKEEIIKTLLSSLRFSPPGGKWQFIWNSRNPFSFSSGIGFEFYIDFEKQIVAAIKVIKCYQYCLKGYSISMVSSLLHKYFESIIADLGADALCLTKDRIKSVLDVVFPLKLNSLIGKLDSFIEANTKPSIYLMPVNGLSCPKVLVTRSISWVGGDFNLSEILNPLGIQSHFVKNAHFPPINDSEIRHHRLTKHDSWFICQAASETEAESIFKRMVGALSVILKYPESRVITGRPMIKGRVRFSHDSSFTVFDRPHLMPAVREPIEITENMVNIFNRLMVEKSDNLRIQIALEFLADAWGNTLRLTLINTSIAMDALFGIDGQVKLSILRGVEECASTISHAREKYDLILEIRNALLHGEYATIELCPHYISFFEKYRTNPIDEQIVIINACLLKLAE